MTVAETSRAIQRADGAALIAVLVAGTVAIVLVLYARRALMQRTSLQLLVNTLVGVTFLLIVPTIVTAYVAVDTVLVKRALLPLARANAKYVGNPSLAALENARARATRIVSNEPGDEPDFVCIYPGWMVYIAALLAIPLGVLLFKHALRKQRAA